MAAGFLKNSGIHVLICVLEQVLTESVKFLYGTLVAMVNMTNRVAILIIYDYLSINGELSN